MALAFGRHESHPLIDALLRPRIERWQELNRAIDERDDMLDFAMQLHEHDRDAALLSYFHNGLEQLQIVRHIASWRGPVRRMLDFASGYGRLARFLAHDRVAGEITVSDILEGGMQFQAAQFGVKTILSSMTPEEVEAPERYDLIFVASLFTHLPPATFTRWLARLVSFLEPEGLLIFSVHDESIAPERFGEGINFDARSESRVLDTQDYGSTWVTEVYVREQLSSIDPSMACVRMPRALAEWQDVYVVSPAPIGDPRPRRVPKGFIEHCSVDDRGIRFSGWAAVIGDASPERVEIRIDDTVAASTRHFARRDDVARAHGLDAGALTGWECVVPHAAVRSFRYQTATVSVFSHDGAERILFLGTIDAASGFVARERARARDQQIELCHEQMATMSHRLAVLEHEKETLERTIDAMRQSRFWRARDQWFRLKRTLRLTEEQ